MRRRRVGAGVAVLGVVGLVTLTFWGLAIFAVLFVGALLYQLVVDWRASRRRGEVPK